MLRDGFEKPWEPLLPPIAAGWVQKEGKWLNQASKFHPEPSQIFLVSKDSATLDPTAPTKLDITPPPPTLSLEVQHRHALEYKKLHQRIIDAGLYKTPYLSGYGPEFARYLALAALSVVAYRHQWFMLSALLLGLFWHQILFFAHDLGHMGVTHNWVVDRLIGTVIGNFLNGLSIGWWVNNHNTHHLVTNHPSHDPDIEYLPFFAITTKFFSGLYSTFYNRVFEFDASSRFLISIQHKLFYIVLALARVNLYQLSYTYLLKAAFDTRRFRGGRWAFCAEIAGILTFWYCRPRSYRVLPARQLRTTTDVICSDSVAFLHGGLHLQVTHHLFPRLPRHNLREASGMVKQFAKDEGLTYAEFGFVEGNREVVGVLREVAEQVRLVGKVVEVEAREAVEGK
ncbi:hypothetical protein AAF712_003358 [Marasmius tenuissimus]|uniref:Fatty acid desaturase domain-containing protein n=1 Tax=Marasmius tenuissimus TaxID=585030 RepID=A0ABR3A7X1_9AGAR